MNEAKKYKIQIMNEQYVLVSDEELEHILQSTDLVESVMKEIMQKSTDPKKAAVLAALKIASMFFHLKSSLNRVAQKESDLIQQVNQVL